MTVKLVSKRNVHFLRGATLVALLVFGAGIALRTASVEARFVLAAASPPDAGARLLAEGGTPIGLRTRIDALNACASWLASPRFALLLDEAALVVDACDTFAGSIDHGGTAEARLVQAAAAWRRDRDAEIAPYLARSRAAAPHDAWLAAQRLRIAARLDEAMLELPDVRALVERDLHLVAKGWRHLDPIGRLLIEPTPFRDLALASFENADPEVVRRVSGAISRASGHSTSPQETSR
jgi:hypothetical protein